MFDWKDHPNLLKIVQAMDTQEGHEGMFSKSPDLQDLSTKFSFTLLNLISIRAQSTVPATLLGANHPFLPEDASQTVADILVIGQHDLINTIIALDRDFYDLSMFLTLLFDCDIWTQPSFGEQQ